MGDLVEKVLIGFHRLCNIINICRKGGRLNSYKKQNNMNSKETIVQKVYALLQEAIPLLNNFPRSQKFTLADRIQNRLSDLLEATIRAYYSPAAQKKEILKEINILLEMLRHYFRLGYDLGIYSSLRYKHFAEKLNEIGRMCGGWLKSLK